MLFVGVCPPLGKGGWGDFPMLPYNRRLKTKARSLRTNPTDAELHLWYRLRRKQILGVQFYRQKPIGNYIADFYAPAVKRGRRTRRSSAFGTRTSKIRRPTDEVSRAARIESLAFRRPTSVATNRVCAGGDLSSCKKSLLTSLYKREAPSMGDNLPLIFTHSITR